MTFLGLSEGMFRLSLFAAIFATMAFLEAWLPRRKRRHLRRVRWFTNIGVLISDYAAVAAVTFFIPITATIAAMWAEANGWGILNFIGLPIWLEWIIAFLILDFVIWGQHVLTHKIPILWRIHRVHHSDEDLDATTAVRFHPVEIVLSIFIKALAVIVLGAPAVLVVVFEAIVNGSALFNHANFRIPVGIDRVLRLLVVTPDMHRVHHSVIMNETNSNYGFALSIWDRLFNVYIDQPEKGHDGMTIGLEEWQDDAPTRLGWTLALPFRNPPRSRPDTSVTDGSKLDGLS